MLTRAHRQETLSRAYVQAVAAETGLSYNARERDYGIDATLYTIHRREHRLAEGWPCLDLQIKSTTLAGMTPLQVGYDLELKSYDDLRDPDCKIPRLLVVLVLPQAETEWVSQSEAELVLRKCAFWVSLKGQPATTARKTLRVFLPRSNVFSAAALHGILDRVRQGMEP